MRGDVTSYLNNLARRGQWRRCLDVLQQLTTTQTPLNASRTLLRHPVLLQQILRQSADGSSVADTHAAALAVLTLCGDALRPPPEPPALSSFGPSSSASLLLHSDDAVSSSSVASGAAFEALSSAQQQEWRKLVSQLLSFYSARPIGRDDSSVWGSARAAEAVLALCAWAEDAELGVERSLVAAARGCAEACASRSTGSVKGAARHTRDMSWRAAHLSKTEAPTSARELPSAPESLREETEEAAPQRLDASAESDTPQCMQQLLYDRAARPRFPRRMDGAWRRAAALLPYGCSRTFALDRSVRACFSQALRGLHRTADMMACVRVVLRAHARLCAGNNDVLSPSASPPSSAARAHYLFQCQCEALVEALQHVTEAPVAQEREEGSTAERRRTAVHAVLIVAAAQLSLLVEPAVAARSSTRSLMPVVQLQDTEKRCCVARALHAMACAVLHADRLPTDSFGSGSADGEQRARVLGSDSPWWLRALERVQQQHQCRLQGIQKEEVGIDVFLLRLLVCGSAVSDSGQRGPAVHSAASALPGAMQPRVDAALSLMGRIAPTLTVDGTGRSGESIMNTLRRALQLPVCPQPPTPLSSSDVSEVYHRVGDCRAFPFVWRVLQQSPVPLADLVVFGAALPLPVSQASLARRRSLLSAVEWHAVSFLLLLCWELDEAELLLEAVDDKNSTQTRTSALLSRMMNAMEKDAVAAVLTRLLGSVCHVAPKTGGSGCVDHHHDHHATVGVTGLLRILLSLVHDASRRAEVAERLLDTACALLRESTHTGEGQSADGPEKLPTAERRQAKKRRADSSTHLAMQREVQLMEVIGVLMHVLHTSSEVSIVKAALVTQKALGVASVVLRRLLDGRRSRHWQSGCSLQVLLRCVEAWYTQDVCTLLEHHSGLTLLRSLSGTRDDDGEAAWWREGETEGSRIGGEYEVSTRKLAHQKSSAMQVALWFGEQEAALRHRFDGEGRSSSAGWEALPLFCATAAAAITRQCRGVDYCIRSQDWTEASSQVSSAAPRSRVADTTGAEETSRGVREGRTTLGTETRQRLRAIATAVCTTDYGSAAGVPALCHLAIGTAQPETRTAASRRASDYHTTNTTGVPSLAIHSLVVAPVALGQRLVEVVGDGHKPSALLSLFCAAPSANQRGVLNVHQQHSGTPLSPTQREQLRLAMQDFSQQRRNHEATALFYSYERTGRRMTLAEVELFAQVAKRANAFFLVRLLTYVPPPAESAVLAKAIVMGALKVYQRGRGGTSRRGGDSSRTGSVARGQGLDAHEVRGHGQGAEAWYTSMAIMVQALGLLPSSGGGALSLAAHQQLLLTCYRLIRSGHDGTLPFSHQRTGSRVEETYAAQVASDVVAACLLRSPSLRHRLLAPEWMQESVQALLQTIVFCEHQSDHETGVRAYVSFVRQHVALQQRPQTPARERSAPDFSAAAILVPLLPQETYAALLSLCGAHVKASVAAREAAEWRTGVVAESEEDAAVDGRGDHGAESDAVSEEGGLVDALGGQQTVPSAGSSVLEGGEDEVISVRGVSGDTHGQAVGESSDLDELYRLRAEMENSEREDHRPPQDALPAETRSSKRGRTPAAAETATPASSPRRAAAFLSHCAVAYDSVRPALTPSLQAAVEANASLVPLVCVLHNALRWCLLTPRRAHGAAESSGEMDAWYAADTTMANADAAAEAAVAGADVLASSLRAALRLRFARVDAEARVSTTRPARDVGADKGGVWCCRRWVCVCDLPCDESSWRLMRHSGVLLENVSGYVAALHRTEATALWISQAQERRATVAAVECLQVILAALMATDVWMVHYEKHTASALTGLHDIVSGKGGQHDELSPRAARVRLREMVPPRLQECLLQLDSAFARTSASPTDAAAQQLEASVVEALAALRADMRVFQRCSPAHPALRRACRSEHEVPESATAIASASDVTPVGVPSPSAIVSQPRYDVVTGSAQTRFAAIQSFLHDAVFTPTLSAPPQWYAPGRSIALGSEGSCVDTQGGQLWYVLRCLDARPDEPSLSQNQGSTAPLLAVDNDRGGQQALLARIAAADGTLQCLTLRLVETETMVAQLDQRFMSCCSSTDVMERSLPSDAAIHAELLSRLYGVSQLFSQAALLIDESTAELNALQLTSTVPLQAADSLGGSLEDSRGAEDTRGSPTRSPIAPETLHCLAAQRTGLIARLADLFVEAWWTRVLPRLDSVLPACAADFWRREATRVEQLYVAMMLRHRYAASAPYERRVSFQQSLERLQQECAGAARTSASLSSLPPSAATAEAALADQLRLHMVDWDELLEESTKESDMHHEQAMESARLETALLHFLVEYDDAADACGGDGRSSEQRQRSSWVVVPADVFEDTFSTAVARQSVLHAALLWRALPLVMARSGAQRQRSTVKADSLGIVEAASKVANGLQQPDGLVGVAALTYALPEPLWTAMASAAAPAVDPSRRQPLRRLGVESVLGVALLSEQPLLTDGLVAHQLLRLQQREGEAERGERGVTAGSVEGDATSVAEQLDPSLQYSTAWLRRLVAYAVHEDHEELDAAQDAVFLRDGDAGNVVEVEEDSALSTSYLSTCLHAAARDSNGEGKGILYGSLVSASLCRRVAPALLLATLRDPSMIGVDGRTQRDGTPQREGVLLDLLHHVGYLAPHAWPLALCLVRHTPYPLGRTRPQRHSSSRSQKEKETNAGDLNLMSATDSVCVVDGVTLRRLRAAFLACGPWPADVGGPLLAKAVALQLNLMATCDRDGAEQLVSPFPEAEELLADVLREASETATSVIGISRTAFTPSSMTDRGDVRQAVTAHLAAYLDSQETAEDDSKVKQKQGSHNEQAKDSDGDGMRQLTVRYRACAGDSLSFFSSRMALTWQEAHFSISGGSLPPLEPANAASLHTTQRGKELWNGGSAVAWTPSQGQSDEGSMHSPHLPQESFPTAASTAEEGEEEARVLLHLRQLAGLRRHSSDASSAAAAVGELWQRRRLMTGLMQSLQSVLSRKVTRRGQRRRPAQHEQPRGNAASPDARSQLEEAVASCFYPHLEWCAALTAPKARPTLPQVGGRQEHDEEVTTTFAAPKVTAPSRRSRARRQDAAGETAAALLSPIHTLLQHLGHVASSHQRSDRVSCPPLLSAQLAEADVPLLHRYLTAVLGEVAHRRGGADFAALREFMDGTETARVLGTLGCTADAIQAALVRTLAAFIEWESEGHTERQVDEVLALTAALQLCVVMQPWLPVASVARSGSAAPITEATLYVAVRAVEVIRGRIAASAGCAGGHTHDKESLVLLQRLAWRATLDVLQHEQDGALSSTSVALLGLLHCHLTVPTDSVASMSHGNAGSEEDISVIASTVVTRVLHELSCLGEREAAVVHAIWQRFSSSGSPVTRRLYVGALRVLLRQQRSAQAAAFASTLRLRQWWGVDSRAESPAVAAVEVVEATAHLGVLEDLLCLHLSTVVEGSGEEARGSRSPSEGKTTSLSMRALPGPSRTACLAAYQHYQAVRRLLCDAGAAEAGEGAAALELAVTSLLLQSVEEKHASALSPEGDVEVLQLSEVLRHALQSSPLWNLAHKERVSASASLSAADASPAPSLSVAVTPLGDMETIAVVLLRSMKEQARAVVAHSARTSTTLPALLSDWQTLVVPVRALRWVAAVRQPRELHVELRVSAEGLTMGHPSTAPPGEHRRRLLGDTQETLLAAHYATLSLLTRTQHLLNTPVSALVHDVLLPLLALERRSALGSDGCAADAASESCSRLVNRGELLHAVARQLPRHPALLLLPLSETNHSDSGQAYGVKGKQKVSPSPVTAEAELVRAAAAVTVTWSLSSSCKAEATPRRAVDLIGWPAALVLYKILLQLEAPLLLAQEQQARQGHQGSSAARPCSAAQLFASLYATALSQQGRGLTAYLAFQLLTHGCHSTLDAALPNSRVRQWEATEWQGVQHAVAVTASASTVGAVLELFKSTRHEASCAPRRHASQRQTSRQGAEALMNTRISGNATRVREERVVVAALTEEEAQLLHTLLGLLRRDC